MNYFEQYPLMEYDGLQMRNILRKVVIRDIVKEDALAFLPYTVSDVDKPWTLAYDYYGSVDRMWLVLLSNNIIDPVYDWYMDTRSFESFMKKKYGSIETAQSTILHYKDSDGNLYSKDTATINSTGLTAVYAYDYEDEQNEAKRNVMLLERAYAKQAEKNLRDLLKDE